MEIKTMTKQPRPRLTISKVRQLLPTCVRFNSSNGEYRIAYTEAALRQIMDPFHTSKACIQEKAEDTAYYTTSLDDALSSGLAMGEVYHDAVVRGEFWVVGE